MPGLSVFPPFTNLSFTNISLMNISLISLGFTALTSKTGNKVVGHSMVHILLRLESIRVFKLFDARKTFPNVWNGPSQRSFPMTHDSLSTGVTRFPSLARLDVTEPIRLCLSSNRKPKD
ncbi:hypothetical protein C8J56DRAFT_1059572 [Mycena floridula]|nr:hypothetical protein C8J56DRAFT_1059561 [Mycena floridula]KAJ7579348.1 hypothetical protein C8J56DRAFT_1059572 [Mycena floridula]